MASFWVIFLDGDTGKVMHSGPYPFSLRATKWADDMVTSGKYDIVETRSGTWDGARQEVKQKLADNHKDAGIGAKRFYGTGKESS